MQIIKNLPAELSEVRAVSTASGGTALTTTATGASAPGSLGMVSIPAGSDWMSITPRNFSGCNVVRVSLNPRLVILATWDAGETTVDISDEMQDGDTTDYVMDSFPITGTGYIWVGARIPFRGVAVDIGTDPNATANDLTVYYWNGTSWVDLSDTDTTDTGASFAVDGTVTWTVPASWAAASLSAIGTSIGSGVEYALPASTPHHATPLYWSRWEWSAAMEAGTDVAQMLSLNRSTAALELLEGQPLELMVNHHEIANVQGITDAGTANLVVNVGTLAGNEFD
jgi:hypothetical protein